MLGDTLESWLGVDQSGVRAEIVVIDNASTDATREVVEKRRGEFSTPLRYVYEGRQGLSFARNRGIDEASGEIIAFVDDDIYFDSSWLTEIFLAFRQHPEVSCVGGMSIPTFEVDKPAWLTEAMLNLYGSTLSGDRDRVMEYPEHPFGVNMAFRRDVFDTVGKFATDLGRIKNSLLSNEEKDIFYRIDAAGLKVYYASGAVLHHRVPADRLRQEWVLRRVYWQGVSNVIFDQSTRRKSRLALCKETARHLKRLVAGGGNTPGIGIFTYLRGGSFENKMRAYKSLGVIRQNLLEVFRITN